VLWMATMKSCSRKAFSEEQGQATGAADLTVAVAELSRSCLCDEHVPFHCIVGLGGCLCVIACVCVSIV
jgi:hypothetical protein